MRTNPSNRRQTARCAGLLALGKARPASQLPTERRLAVEDSGTWSARRPCAALVLLGLAGASLLRAGLPEPDTVFYGAIAINNVFITARHTNVTVQLRKSPTGPPVAVYRMGDKPAAGDRYVLRAPVESAAPVNDPAATPVGGTVYLVVLESNSERHQATHVITGRGEFVNLNFGAADTDGDGLSDAFEQQYFGSATGADPNADPDNDGRSNLEEFRQGTHPLVADTRHPADTAPANWTLTAAEVDAYAQAWKLGEAWSNAPVDIPISYVTRAGALRAGGGTYAISNTLPVPLWWVNVPPAPATNGPSGLTAIRRLPPHYAVFTPFQVGLDLTPGPGTRSWALEETPPAGWLVRFVSDEGHYDAARGKIRWGPFFTGVSRTLTYQLTPLSLGGAAAFAGLGSFDGTNVAVAGAFAVYPPGQLPVALLRPEFTRATATFAFDLIGPPGAQYVVESSLNLTSWSAGPTVTLDPAGFLRVNLAPPPGATRGFYRVRLP